MHGTRKKFRACDEGLSTEANLEVAIVVWGGRLTGRYWGRAKKRKQKKRGDKKKKKKRRYWLGGKQHREGLGFTIGLAGHLGLSEQYRLSKSALIVRTSRGSHSNIDLA